jgi:phosphatidylglycerol lysyltransferase
LWRVFLPQFLDECALEKPQPVRYGHLLAGIRAPVCNECVQAAEIVGQYARSPLDLLKLWPSKRYLFSASGKCVIAYGVANGTAVALGDPVGPEAEIEPTIRRFVRLCKNERWAVAFYRTLPDFVPTYQRLQFRKLKIGDDAIVELSRFSLQGRTKRDIRSKTRQLEAQGVRVAEYEPPLPSAVVARMKSVSDEWLRIPGRRERTFAVGYFDSDYLRSTPVLAAVDVDGKMLAFINLISVNRDEITGDLMRRRSNAPNGIMDYLFFKLLQYSRERGYSKVSLGLAPMTGFRDEERATVEERVIHAILQKLGFLFSFRGLYRYKAKFATSWEPRYLIYENMFQLPRTALALHRLSETRGKRNAGPLGGERLAYNSR